MTAHRMREPRTLDDTWGAWYSGGTDQLAELVAPANNPIRITVDEPLRR